MRTKKSKYKNENDEELQQICIVINTKFATKSSICVVAALSSL